MRQNHCMSALLQSFTRKKEKPPVRPLMPPNAYPESVHSVTHSFHDFTALVELLIMISFHA